MSHDEYLRSYFVELEELQPGSSDGVSHAISCEEGVLYALVSMGDVRAKLLIQEVDPDPAKMAANVVELWRACLDKKKVVLE